MTWFDQNKATLLKEQARDDKGRFASGGGNSSYGKGAAEHGFRHSGEGSTNPDDAEHMMQSHQQSAADHKEAAQAARQAGDHEEAAWHSAASLMHSNAAAAYSRSDMKNASSLTAHAARTSNQANGVQPRPKV